MATTSRRGSQLIGEQVQKLFDDGNFYTGKVTKYDVEDKWYWVEYEDGDEEEVDHDELLNILCCLKGGEVDKRKQNSDSGNLVSDQISKKSKKSINLETNAGSNGTPLKSKISRKKGSKVSRKDDHSSAKTATVDIVGEQNSVSVKNKRGRKKGSRSSNQFFADKSQVQKQLKSPSALPQQFLENETENVKFIEKIGTNNSTHISVESYLKLDTSNPNGLPFSKEETKLSENRKNDTLENGQYSSSILEKGTPVNKIENKEVKESSSLIDAARNSGKSKGSESMKVTTGPNENVNLESEMNQVCLITKDQKKEKNRSSYSPSKAQKLEEEENVRAEKEIINKISKKKLDFSLLDDVFESIGKAKVAEYCLQVKQSLKEGLTQNQG